MSASPASVAEIASNLVAAVIGPAPRPLFDLECSRALEELQASGAGVQELLWQLSLLAMSGHVCAVHLALRHAQLETSCDEETLNQVMREQLTRAGATRPGP